MTCTEAKTRIHQALDDGGPDAALDQHLSKCTECRVYDTDMRRLRIVLGELRKQTETPTSPQVSSRNLRPARFAVRRRVLAAAASIALLIVALRFLPKSSKTEIATGPTATMQPASRDPRLGLSLRGDSAAKLLAVASPRTDSDVQVYFLYPRLDAVAVSKPRHSPVIE